ncbi:MAG: alpha/beta fold hydrolase, partial [Bacteroidota bacterium]
MKRTLTTSSLLLVSGLLLMTSTGMAQPSEGRPLQRPPSLLKRSGAAPTTVELFISVGLDSLDATYYVPPFPPPDSNGYPGMIFVHGFGGDKSWDTASAAIRGALGYVSLCYSVRAHGKSSGSSSIMGPSERSDLARVVEFLRNLPEVNPDRIGIQGGSQGGLHSLWAVADSLPVRAASGDVITPHWASDMFVNGAIRHTLTFLLQTPSVRYGPGRDSLWDLVRDDEYDLLR